MLRYRLHGFSDDWIIPELPVPEAAWHDGCLELFKALLAAWVATTGRDAAVLRDIAVRTNPERPRVGFNADVCLVEPAPPGAAVLESLRLWEHPSPRLAFEAVSRNHPYKDYALVPEKCAVTGIGELVVFDPLLAGPRAQGGPWLLQVWRRADDGGFDRVHAGHVAAPSAVLGAYLVPDASERRLRIAERPDGTGLWLTSEEQARHDAQRAREREERATRRIAELEAELAKRGR